MWRHLLIVAVVVSAALAALGTGARRADAVTLPVARVDGPHAGIVGVPIQFTGAASTGSNLAFVWDFGGGITARGVVVQHVFATPGVFPVTLTVRDGLGRVSVAVKTVTIGLGNAVVVGRVLPFCVTTNLGLTCRQITPVFAPVCTHVVFIRHAGIFRPFCRVLVPSPVIVVRVAVRVVFVPVRVVCPLTCVIFADP